MTRRPLLLSIVVSTFISAQQAPGPVARFDWFTYEGRDAVYESRKSSPDEFSNPVLAGFYPDPSIERVGADYYLVTSSFAYFPGVPIFRSRDLVSWTQIGHVLNRPSQLNLDSAGVSRGIFAPVIRYHARTYYMITTLIDRGGNFFVTATNPAGPWSDPIWLPEVDGIDPSFFFDDNGKAYILNNGPPVGTPLYNGHRAIWIQEFDVDKKKTVGPRTLIVNGGVDLSKKPIWIEAPHILKRDGAYYLICAEGGTADQHSEVVFKSASPLGPFVPYRGNPILTQRHLDKGRALPVTSTGHADFVQTPRGDWWAVFLGTRPYADDMYNTGRETFLMPVRWVDGWPVITVDSQTVPYRQRRPRLTPQTPPSVPTSGNFTHRDEFDGTALAPYWQLLRTPRERWYDLSSTPGTLTIRARPALLSGRDQPSFIARRQQHGTASATVSMRYRPTKPGDKAGLVAFQNERFHYFVGLTMHADGGVTVDVEQQRANGGRDTTIVLASRPWTAPSDSILLRIQARNDRYDFFYASGPGAWVPLAQDADGTMLSTRVAGGFVGAMLGMYAYSPLP